MLVAVLQGVILIKKLLHKLSLISDGDTMNLDHVIKFSSEFAGILEITLCYLIIN